MRLEEEIKQEKFQSPQQKAFLNIQFTGNWLAFKSNKFFGEFGLTNQQYNVLRILRGHYPVPISLASIQERMIDKSSNVTRLLEKLVNKGLANSERNNQNKRKIDILITAKGFDLLADIDTQISSQEEVANRLSDEEANLLNELLEKIRE